MPNSRQSKRLTLGMPASYRIGVQGRLDSSLISRLGSMRIDTCSAGGEAPMTTLVGWLRDQAEPIGVLNGLYDLHLPLLSVVILNDQ